MVHYFQMKQGGACMIEYIVKKIHEGYKKP